MNQQQQLWQSIAGALLAKYFGVMLCDTDLCEKERVISLHTAGVRPFEAVNELVDKYQLERLDANPFRPCLPHLNAVNELIASAEAGINLVFIRHL